jgi:hypothetical protein
LTDRLGIAAFDIQFEHRIVRDGVAVVTTGEKHDRNQQDESIHVNYA